MMKQYKMLFGLMVVVVSTVLNAESIVIPSKIQLDPAYATAAPVNQTLPAPVYQQHDDGYLSKLPSAQEAYDKLKGAASHVYDQFKGAANYARDTVSDWWHNYGPSQSGSFGTIPAKPAQ